MTSGTNQVAHTGSFGLKLPSSANVGDMAVSYGGSIGSSDNDFFATKKKYRANVWVKTAGHPGAVALLARLNGQIIAHQTGAQYIFKAGAWYLLEIIADIPANSSGDCIFSVERNTPGGDIYIDDFRVLPQKARMSCYVYDQQTGQVTFTLDNDHIASKAAYDHAGRPVRSYLETDAGFRLVSENEINFGKGVE
jgi:hypothetical protein